REGIPHSRRNSAQQRLHVFIGFRHTMRHRPERERGGVCRDATVAQSDVRRKGVHRAPKLVRALEAVHFLTERLAAVEIGFADRAYLDPLDGTARRLAAYHHHRLSLLEAERRIE